MAADDNCNVSKRCLRYRDMDFPLMEYMMAYMANPYDKENNPEVIIINIIINLSLTNILHKINVAVRNH
jgi:hypothetical protein